MKQKLLFVLPSLRSGGAEKSLATLLRLLDYSRYDVDLLLFRREGLFLPQVPPQVRVLDAGEEYAVFDGAARPALAYFLRRGMFLTALRRILYGRAIRKSAADSLPTMWRQLRRMLPKLSGYETAVAYLEGTSTYYVLDCVQAKKKVAFLHTDYDRIAFQKDMDAPYYARLDRLVGVSAQCTEKAEVYFPCLVGKTATVQNLIAPSVLHDMAKAERPLPQDGTPNLLTVGRMSEPKGIDMAVCACGELMRRGYDFRWYHIGVGEQQREIEALIEQQQVRQRFILLGERGNPYPYYQQCDIYVQPSRFEGKSIAVDEAKCFARPIVVTDFGTVRDQIEDGVDGLIAPISPQGIADAVQRLLCSPQLRQSLSDNLQEEKTGNEEEIEKLYALL